jgi:antitoxin component YwqK of YwqJK toxin-antitoxin module
MQSPNKHIALMAGLCLLSTTVALFLGRWSERSRTHESVLSLDNNADGSPDAELHYEKEGTIIRAQHDRNFDGTWDYFEWFDKGAITRAEADDDFNGRIDSWLTYKSGNLHQTKFDLDAEGTPDIVSYHRYGVIQASVCCPNGSTNHVRVELYKNGVPQSIYRDADGDGLLEELINYDQFGNELRREKVTPPRVPSEISLK